MPKGPSRKLNSIRTTLIRAAMTISALTRRWKAGGVAMPDWFFGSDMDTPLCLLRL